MKIALYSRHIDEADRASYEQLVFDLNHNGISTVELRDGDSAAECDFLFSIGGDGTLLSSVQCADPASLPPILGINFGHLGFLTTVGKDNIKGMVDSLLAGDYTLEQRTLLRTAYSLAPATGTERSEAFTLNEVFLHRGESASFLRIKVTVDGRYVCTYAGDGVIVATPTGSTAYSLSCGGPILTPDSRCLAITPICAHTLTQRPIIIPDTAKLDLVVEDATSFTLGMDSRRTHITGPAEFNLQLAPFSIRLVRMGNQDFFSAIRDKLMWGTEIRL